MKKVFLLSGLVAAQLLAVSIDKVEFKTEQNNASMKIDGSLSGNMTIYIDQDNNPNTGYPISQFKGADAKIELSDVSHYGNASQRKYLNRLYKYQTGSQQAWKNWEKQSFTPDIEVGRGYVDISFDADKKMEDSSKLMIALAQKGTWNNIVASKTIQKSLATHTDKPVSSEASEEGESTANDTLYIQKGGFENIQILVNTDGTSNGYKDTHITGAKYKIELAQVMTKTGDRAYLNYLYKYEGDSANTWENWKEIYKENLDNASVIAVGNNAIMINIATILGKLGTKTSSCVVKLDRNWKIISQSEAGISTASKPNKEKPSTSKPASDKGSMSAKSISFAKGGYKHVQIFFDTDNNAQSGYSLTGANYMLELGYVERLTGDRAYVTSLYQYHGTGNSWSNWKKVNGVSLDMANVVDVKDGSISVSMDALFADRDVSDTIPYVITRKDSRWKNTQSSTSDIAHEDATTSSPAESYEEPVVVEKPAQEVQTQEGTHSNNGLRQDVVESLSYMGNEERLAYDVYMTLYDYHKGRGDTIKQFKNISNNSEKKHITRVQELVRKYNIDITTVQNVKNPVSTKDVSLENMPKGKYDVKEIQELYDSLYEKGIESKQSALEVGCIIEVVDVDDLDKYISQAEDAGASDVVDAFKFLRKGSYNHYWSFDRTLKKMGVEKGCGVLGSAYVKDYPQNEKGKHKH